MRKVVDGILIVIAVLVLGSPHLWAQGGTTTGALTGTVANSDGAPMPGVAVRLISGSTGQEQTVNTDLDGHYGFLSLNPGSYAAQFSSQGFKTANISDIVVNVSEETGVAARLEPGASDDPAACLCTVTHSASSSGGSLMDSEAITAAPLTSRNITQVLATSAGAAGNVTNAGLLGNRNQAVSVNGQNGGNFTIDGTDSTTPPNPDTISQFRIQTTQYDSGYGARVPTTNLLTRSGSNDFHGALWEFVRNNMFNANDYFSIQAHQPKPDLKQNQFGGTFGGPIKRDRLFFFGSYQGTRQVNGLDPTSHSTVILPPLSDDRSAEKIGSQFCTFPTFAGGTQVACNGSNINPIALKILQMKLPDGSYVIPTPQVIQSTGLGRSSYSLPSFWNEDQYLGNMDYVLSKRHTLAGRFFYTRVDQLRSFGSPGGFVAGDPGVRASSLPFTPGAPQTFQNSGYVASLKLTTVLTSKLVNEVRVGYRRSDTKAAGPGIPTATSLGMIPVDPFFDKVPQMVVESFQFFGNYQNDQDSNERFYSWADSLSWIHGNHAIRTGVHADLEDENRFDPGLARGKITFQNFTDFLLGLSAAENGSPEGLSNIDSIQANEGAGPQGQEQNRRRRRSIAAYVQDDIKLRPRFTLNLGLRWEHLPPNYDLGGQLSNSWLPLLALMPIPPASGTYIGSNVAANYDPNTINPYSGRPFGPPPTGVLNRTTKGLFQDNGPWDSFAPRIGLAWQPGSKQKRISIRSGYGWFYQQTNYPSFQAPPFSQSFTNSSASNSASNLNKPFPTATLGFQLRTPTSRLTDRVAGPDFKLPAVQQWNFAMQLTLLPRFTLDIGYVGSFGTHLQIMRGLNQPLLASVAYPVNCGYNGGNPADIANCITTNTSKNAAQRTPILGETPTSLLSSEYVGISRYNGLQTTLRKQVSRGVSFQVSYTYSKSMDNAGNWINDQRDRRLNFSRADSDRTHRLVFNYSYEIPDFLHTDGFTSALLTGWSVSGATSAQSGTPLTLTDRRGASVYGRTGISTITECPGATYTDLETSGKESARLNRWFNNSAICAAPVLGTDGLATGYGTAGRSIVNGPSQNDWDISVGKITRVGGIHEDAQLQLRVEFYNAFNHPQFANPGTSFGSSNFGFITQTSVAPRLIQFGVKYLF